jgi:hypothetical protein
VNDDEQRLRTADLVRGGEPSEEHSVAADRIEPIDEHEEREPLFSAEDTQQFGDRWTEVQAAFVDEPRRAVQDADALVAELMERLAETFSEERSTLEGQWDRDEDVTTEDLRLALQRYRSFFDRLLSA